MKNISLIPAIFIFLIIGLVGCSRQIECPDPPIGVSLVSFDENALDTIVVRRFRKDGDFKNLIDTTLITRTNGGITSTGDTTDILLQPYNSIIAGFDWHIYLPLIDRTITITEIAKRDKTGKCTAMATKCFCHDEIRSLKVDNETGKLEPKYFRLFIR